MFKLFFVAVCSFALGVVLMDTLYEPQKQIPIAQAVLGYPIVCDATVSQRTKPSEPWSHKCYIAKSKR